MLINDVIDDEKLSNKIKEIIKYINKHDGVIDKIFLDIYNDLKNQCSSISKTDDSINMQFNDTNTGNTIINNCIEHHLELSIPEKLCDISKTFLFKVVKIDLDNDGNNESFQIIRKR